MKLVCESCRAKIHAEDVNLDRSLAKCRACNAVFDFTPQLGRPDIVPKTQSVVAKPRGIRMHEWGAGVILARRWFRPHHLFLALFCLAWDSFLLVWYALAFGHDTPWIVKVFPVAHVAVGLVLTYYTLAGFLNRTSVRVEHDELKVRHRPLPWRGTRDMKARDITQVFCRRRLAGGQGGVFEVVAIDRDGFETPLIALVHKNEALFVEQKLEYHLGIDDRPVAGEVSK